MTHLPWYRAFPSNRHQAGNDIELLQTDVMRFMAILGLSLMAIFALVQGIRPQVRTLPGPPPYESPLLVAKPSRSAVGHDETAVPKLRRRLAHAEQTVFAAQSEAARAGQARDQALAALASAQKTIDSHRVREAELRRKLGEHKQSVARLRRELESKRRQAELASALPAVLPPEPAQPKRAAKRPSEQGFSLRFASESALTGLITTGAVDFYGFADRAAWRLRVRQGALTYQSVPLPRAYHEMQPVTVPAGFVRALKESVPRGVPTTVVWGVTLSAKIARSINRLMQQYGSGSLVIERNGRVRREGESA